MAEKTKEPKIILEREYMIPLRSEILKVPRYKRANKAVKAVKEFLARHMKVYDRDLDKIKIDKFINEELWFRGIKNPLHKIKVKARKFDDGIVKAELAEIPEKIKFKIEREKKLKEKTEKAREEIKKEQEEKKTEEKIEKEEKAEEKTEKVEEDKKKEAEEKEKSVVESGLRVQEQQHKEAKHYQAQQKIKKQPLKRMALQK